MVLREIDELPAFAVNFIKKIILCLARMARESPTFAQTTSSPSMRTLTSVDPLQEALMSDSVRFFWIF
jgi:hypothetical protein